jgi:hypothetical protein
MTKLKVFVVVLLLLPICKIFGQATTKINLTISELLSTYDFVKNLSNNYPDNKYKQLFKASEFNIEKYNALVQQMDTLTIDYSYDFQGYPTGQKQAVMTSSLLERNLIRATSIEDFKTISFGIIPSSDLIPFAHIISEFTIVYNKLVFIPNKQDIETTITDLNNFVSNNNLTSYFTVATQFYGTTWDYSVPIDIAIIPSIKGKGFTATSLQNVEISEVPVNYKNKKILFCVLLHEIFHTLYDEQTRNFKLEIASIFNKSKSKYSQYAYLLLNEALATAMGNGYVYEQLNGSLDKEDWYHLKYINLMAKQIYPLVKEYIMSNKTIDENFINQYINIYEQNFAIWVNELDHLFTYRYMLSEDEKDFRFINQNYRYRNISFDVSEITESSLEKMKNTPITKVIIVSTNTAYKLKLIKDNFIELKSWKYNPKKEFVHIVELKDKTKLIIINKKQSTIESIFETNFKGNILKNGA